MVSVEEFYATGAGLYYWLNNFDNIFNSFGREQFQMAYPSTHTDRQTDRHHTQSHTHTHILALHVV